MKVGLELTAESNLLFSAHAGTAGNHKSLGCIPGSSLLGVAAARLYSKLSAAESWLVFHSGLVRFGTLRPSEGGEESWAVPRSWHHKKESGSHHDGRFGSAQIWDFACPEHGFPFDDSQPKAIRQGFVTLSGKRISHDTALHVMSARDPATGRTLESALFAYETLPEGSRFRGVLSADPSIDPSLFERVVDALQGEARVGGSRSAQFGHVTVRRIGDLAPIRAIHHSDRVSFLLVSDLALADEHGQPTLIPAPALFGLDPKQATFDPEHSFIGWRSYRPFNVKRQRPDLQRHVMVAGSVLSFDSRNHTPDALEAFCERPIGLHKQDGLGWVLANPTFLGNAAHPIFSEAPSETAPAVATRPVDALSNWAFEQSKRLGEVSAGVGLGKTLTEQLRKARCQLAAEHQMGATQWNQLRLLAQNAEDSEGLDKVLNEFFTKGVTSVHWQAQIWLNNDQTSLANIIKKSLRGQTLGAVQVALQHACKSMDREIHSYKQGE